MATGTIRGRIGRALGAGAFGQAVTVLVQLASIPLFLRYWGIERYGEWLILSAIPSYLALSDLGFGSAAANEMTMAAGAGNRDRVLAWRHLYPFAGIGTSNCADRLTVPMARHSHHAGL